ncbi:MAG: thiamine ABC transporter substrate-binding protein [Caldilineaceae bacterium]
MGKIHQCGITLVAALIFLSACQPLPSGQDKGGAAPESSAPIPLVLATHDSFSISEDVLTQFEDTHNVKLQVLQMGDAGEALNRVILSKDAPLADLFFGVDNSFLSRALDADIFIPYASPQLANVRTDLQLDSANRLLPVDFGFVNLNADRAWFDEHNLPLPATLEDLAKPDYKGLLVVQNPATSSPGLAFLAATVAHFGQDGYLDFWQALRANDALITTGWTEAYFDHFTVGSGGAGDRPLVVSYSTSPPADVVFATDGRTEPASVNLSLPNAVFRQIEFVGILKGTKHLEQAQTFVDFMLDKPFQEDVPLQMYVFPANVNAALPDVFTKFAEVVADPVPISPETIEAERENWIAAWTEVMLR